MQIIELGREHAFVVNLWQRVQLLLYGLELRPQGLVLDFRQLAQVAVLGMEGIDADGVVGIAVLPGMSHVRVVDGQYL